MLEWTDVFEFFILSTIGSFVLLCFLSASFNYVCSQLKGLRNCERKETTKTPPSSRDDKGTGGRSD